MVPKVATLADFVKRWQDSKLKERSGSQPHFIELCRVLNVDAPTDVDMEGSFYCFEKGAGKSQGGDGWADVWLKDHFGWEYKGKHKDLKAAYQQLQQYREDLLNPPLLVVSDMDRFEIHTQFENMAKRVYAFNLDALLSDSYIPGVKLTAYNVLKAVFEDPELLRPGRTVEEVTRQAAKDFSELARRMRLWKYDPLLSAHYLMRVLFAMFSEDIGLLPNAVFTTLVANTRENPAAYNAGVRDLFAKMAKGGFYGPVPIPYINGGLFDAREIDLDLTSDEIEILHKLCKLNWASIEPLIVGTLFERGLDPGNRTKLGAHFTSSADILSIIEPVVLAPLRREWANVRELAETNIALRDRATDDKSRNALHAELKKTLVDFNEHLSQVRILDPACGSGNFLYVTLKKLLDLEKEVAVFASMSGVTGVGVKIDPTQLFGIEVNPYAFELANIVVWIGYLQWLRDNGYNHPFQPVLKHLENIQNADALMDLDKEGNITEAPWPDVDFIIGNPPFLGDKLMKRA